MESTDTIDSAERARLISAQKHYCKTNGLKMRMPPTGYCFHCGRCLVSQFGRVAAERLIVVCFLCGRRC